MPNTKKIQLVSGLPKPDWSITDETNAGYIKNKPTTLAGYGITDAASLVDGKIPESFLPSYVDDVLEYANKASFPTSGETGKIYVDTTTNLTYRWSGSTYVEISPSIALGETSSTAYYGDKGKVAYEHSQTTHAPSNAEKNIIVGIQKNGTDVSVDSNTRKVNITVPTKTSDLSNDSGFITTSDIPEGAAASTTTPKMDGTATVGTETTFARGDHIHPSDTSKVDKIDGKGLSTNDYTNSEKSKLAGIETGANKTTIDSTLSVSGNAADAKATGDAISNLSDLVGDTSVSDQISAATIAITNAEIDEICSQTIEIAEDVTL